MIRFTYRIRFFRGNLEGIEIDQSLPFVCVDDFESWVNLVNASRFVDYRVVRSMVGQ